MNRKAILILFIALSFATGAFTQNQKPIFISNSSMEFADFFKGVKYAEITLNVLNQEKVDLQTDIAPLFYVAQKYLQQIGFEYVALTSPEKVELEVSIQSYCQVASVMFGGDIDKNAISNMTITFVSCNGDVFGFQSTRTFKYKRFADVEKKLIEDWKTIVGVKPAYDMTNQLALPANLTLWNNQKAQRYLENRTDLHEVEGVYERVRLSFEDISGGKYNLFVVKDDQSNEYLIIYLLGAGNTNDWREGEIKGKLKKTATLGFYSVEWIGRDKSYYDDVYCQINQWGFRIFSTGISSINHQFIKVFPVHE